MAERNEQRFLDPHALARVANLNLVARRVVEGFIAGLHKSPYHGFSVEFADHRKYVPGDDLKHLDWRVYGKSDRFYIKRYQKETNLRAYLMLDASASMGYGSAGLSKLEYGCYLSACLAYLATRQQDSVGLMVYDHEIRSYLPPRQGSVHLQNLLRSLSRLQPAQATQSIRAFRKMAETIKRKGLVLVISDLWDDPDELLQGLRYFRHKGHDVVVFHTLDPDELRFPFNRPVIFEDLESQQRIATDGRALRADYLSQLESFLTNYRLRCREHEIDYQQTDTSTPYDHFLAHYLCKREAIR